MNNKQHPFVIRRASGSFGVIGKAIMADPDLSWKSKGIIAYLISRGESWEVRMVNVIKSATDGEKAVQAAFQELKDHGYAMLKTLKDGNKFLGKQWIISESQEFLKKDTSLDTPVLGESQNGGLFINTNKNINIEPYALKKERVEEYLHLESEEQSKEQQSSKNQLLMLKANAIYNQYPRKRARPDAIRSILKAFKQKEPTELMAIVERFAELWSDATKEDKMYCPYPASFFNKEYYNDEDEWNIPKSKQTPIGKPRQSVTIGQNKFNADNPPPIGTDEHNRWLTWMAKGQR